MLYLIPFFVFLPFRFPFQIDWHPFHVSVCTIYFNEAEKSLQITHKIFADDLETTLNNAGYRMADNGYVDVLNPTDRKALDATIEKYLRQHFSITLNGKTPAAQYLGYEQEELALWCYMEITGVEKIDAMGITYTVLLEQFDDQINLVHVNYKGAIKSLRLDHEQESDKVVFD